MRATRLQGKMHVRMQPTCDDFEAALFSMLDYCASAVDGIPVIQPVHLKPYSPFALPEKAVVPEERISDQVLRYAQVSKETYSRGKSGLFLWQTWPIPMANGLLPQ